MRVLLVVRDLRGSEPLEENYYLRSPLRFPSAAHRHRVENLQKLFALLVEVPALERWVRPFLHRPPSLITLSIFRTWFMDCYLRRIVPHRIRASEWLALARTLFGAPTPEERDDLARTQ